MSVKKINVGVVGCGGICKKTYMDNMVNTFAVINVVGCYDLLEYRMDYMVNKYGIKKYSSLEEICSDPEIQVICNLTYPESHVLVSKTAMEHGKHVYCEKMMAPTFEEALMLHNLAEEKGVLFTTAPDTFLSAWQQSARKYIDDGFVGKPIAVHAQISVHYEPNAPYTDTAPKHYFFPLHYGGGIPFDLGGYFIHQMINLFGTVKRVAGFGGNLFPNRTYSNPKHPKYGEPFDVNTPTTMIASLEFENGILGTLNMSSDCEMLSSFTVSGTEGVLKLGNPNNFNDKMYLIRPGAAPETGPRAPARAPAQPVDDDQQQLADLVRGQSLQLPLLHGFYESSRGVGLADMCYALINGRRPRCHNDIGLHSIEIIHGIIESCQTGKIYEMTTRCERPEMIKTSALSVSCQENTLDD